jgi:hypothetical protein
VRTLRAFGFVLLDLQGWGRRNIHGLPPFDAVGSILAHIRLAVLATGNVCKRDYVGRFGMHLQRVTLVPSVSSGFLPASRAQVPCVALPRKTIRRGWQRALLAVFGHVLLHLFDLLRILLDTLLHYRDLFHVPFEQALSLSSFDPFFFRCHAFPLLGAKVFGKPF